MLVSHLFLTLDRLLPRSLAGMPYEYALESIRESIFHELDADCWCRNSYNSGNFVFGLSDLDITIYFSRTKLERSEVRRLKSLLETKKRIFPFLGEANIYLESIAEEFSSSFNYFERQRDPFLNSILTPADSTTRHLDKIVFLLRMLHSDRVKLRVAPQLRVKKWNKHFSDIFDIREGERIIDFDEVVQKIMSLLPGDGTSFPFVLDALNLLKDPGYDDVKIYHRHTPEFWKFLFPNRYLWFEREDAYNGFDAFISSGLAPITLRQIDWEVWGLMSQYPLLPEYHGCFSVHLERLKRLALILEPAGNVGARIEKLLNCVQRSFPS